MNNFSIELAQQLVSSTEPFPVSLNDASVPEAEVDALLLRQLQRYHLGITSHTRREQAIAVVRSFAARHGIQLR